MTNQHDEWLGGHLDGWLNEHPVAAVCLYLLASLPLAGIVFLVVNSLVG